MTLHRIENQLSTGMLILTKLKPFLFSHKESGFFAAIDFEGCSEQSVSEYRHWVMTIKFIVEDYKLTKDMAKIFHLFEGVFILWVRMLMKLEEGKVIEGP